MYGSMADPKACMICGPYTTATVPMPRPMSSPSPHGSTNMQIPSRVPPAPAKAGPGPNPFPIGLHTPKSHQGSRPSASRILPWGKGNPQGMPRFSQPNEGGPFGLEGGLTGNGGDGGVPPPPEPRPPPLPPSPMPGGTIGPGGNPGSPGKHRSPASSSGQPTPFANCRSRFFFLSLNHINYAARNRNKTAGLLLGEAPPD